MAMTKFDQFAERTTELTWAALRVVAGLLWAGHGAQKLFGAFGSKFQPPIASQLGVGAVIELVGGLLLVLGLFTRPVAFLAAGQMAVAFFQFHWKLGEVSINPLLNGGEGSVLFCFIWLVYFARGGGRYSLDALRAKTAS